MDQRKKDRNKARKARRRRQAQILVRGGIIAAAVILAVIFIPRAVGRYQRHQRMKADAAAAKAAAASQISEPEPVVESKPEGNDIWDSNVPVYEEGEIAQPSKDQIIMTDTSIDYRLVLVNPWHKLPDGYQEPETVRINQDAAMSIDVRAYNDYKAMIDACKAAGGDPIVRGSFRTQGQQEDLFNNKKKEFLNQGESEEQAELDAANVVAWPGTSEHQLGLAIDICSSEHPILDEEQENTRTQQWLMAHSWEYGFVLRYPIDKNGITGIIYEPWHYRYVGKEFARQMHKEDLVLEEFLAIYYNTPLPPGIESPAVTAALEGNS